MVGVNNLFLRSHPCSLRGHLLKLTFYGHSCFLIDGKEKVLVDPYLTDNPKATITADKVECDIIAVTHGHRDHLGDAIEIGKRTKAPVVAISEVAKYIEQFTESIALNKGGSVMVKHTKFMLLDAVHSSGIFHAEFKHDGGEAASFIIDTGLPIFHAGDTALFADMRTIGEIHAPIVALLPIGDRYTMGPREAAKAVKWLGVKKVVPMHYNTWPSVVQDPNEFKVMVEKEAGKDIEVIIMAPGDTVEL